MANVKSLKRTSRTPGTVKTDFLALGLFQGQDPAEVIKGLGRGLQTAVTAAAKIESFKGKSDECILVYGNTDIKRIAIFGLGKKSDLTTDDYRKAGARVMNRANGLKAGKITIETASFALKSKLLLQAFTEGLMITGYEFLNYKSDKENEKTVRTVELTGKPDASIIKKVTALSKAVFLARDVSNHPANVATPAFLAEEAKKIGSAPGFKTTVIDESKFETLGLGAFYGVARGSAQPAKLILMEYKGGKKGEKPFALVGKGLTFDSGGISLKPGANMDEMKFDMCGSATVLGVMKAVAELQPKLNIIAAIGSTENMPGGNAQRPGDIVKAYNGKTIEILNTDAEGRLVLADVLAYVTDKYKPAKMMDFATLTGAVLIALGNRVSGIMGNDENLLAEIKRASENSGERVWELPLWEDYFGDIKSKIADIKNLGDGRMAGTISAGMFLKQFVGETPWCHMDIAGTAWGAKKPEYLPKVGATGVAVRLVYDLLENQVK